MVESSIYLWVRYLRFGHFPVDNVDILWTPSPRRDHDSYLRELFPIRPKPWKQGTEVLDPGLHRFCSLGRAVSKPYHGQ